VVDTAYRAFDWLNIEAEFAELVFDSERLDEPLVGLRSWGGARQLTFESPGLVIELELDFQATAPLVGQLVPPRRAEVEIRNGPADVVISANEFGWFWADRLVPGPVSLRITPADGDRRAVVTSWVCLPPPPAAGTEL
jgi:hypothetical protein